MPALSILGSRRSAVAVFVLLLPFIVVASGEQTKNSKDTTDHYVGPEACQPCHEDLFTRVQESAHGSLFKRTTPEELGCEACHGPGEEHFNSGGDRGKIGRYSDATPDVVRAQCSRCHVKAGDAPHARKGVGCLSCHAVHRYQERKSLLLVPPRQLCQKCHSV